MKTNFSEFKEAFNILSLILKQHKLSSLIAAFVPLFIGLTIFTSVFVSTDKTSARPINVRDSSAVVECAYRSFLNRSSDKSGKNYWVKEYQKSGFNSRRLAQRMHKTQEGQYTAYVSSFDNFIRRTYRYCLNRPAPTQDIKKWTNSHLSGTKREDIFNVIVQMGDKPLSFPQEEACKAFRKGGSVIPVCKAGTAGRTTDVVVKKVPGTNIIVNKAWLNNVAGLTAQARRSGYNLQAYQNPRVPYSAGSYRSSEAQIWLANNGFPAARPGTSMHEWGLAIDFECNGTPLNRHASCLRWMRANAPAHGLHILPHEPWHWSSNGH